MKKFLLTACALAAVTAAGAQTILSEDFETGNTGSALRPVAKGDGWTYVDSYTGTVDKYRWHNDYQTSSNLDGNTTGHNNWAVCDAPFTYDEEGNGPREEILLTPELNLDDTYQLQFTWYVGPTNSREGERYDLQVRVVEDGNLDGAETVFSIQNEKMLRDSGVGVFPIESWDHFTSQIDLSDFKGEKVKLAFVYKMYGETANMAAIDDVTVTKFTPAAGPVARLSLDRYNFGTVYIGERMYSDNITLTNVGKDGLRITGIDAPQGFGTTLNTAEVNLQRYQSVDFRLTYNAEIASAAQGDIVLHTTGGDVTIAASVAKQFVPDGAMYEGFENYFAPAGWVNQGWGWGAGGFEGDHAAVGPGDFSATWLRTPQLDLLDGGSVTFTYYNSYDGDYAPEYEIELQLSTDGGNTWNKVWQTADEYLNQLCTVTVDLGEGSDESYLRWYYPAVETDDEGAFDHSYFTLDRVVLPRVYGMDGAPLKAGLDAPAQNTENVYPSGVVLSWTPALFAEGYKLYVGTSSACNELIDGLDVKDALTFSLPDLEYATRYRWRVVGYNANGVCANPSTWSFTTQPDASIKAFPYEENFLGKELPNGWQSIPSSDRYAREWYVNSIYPYTFDGKEYGAVTSFWLNAGESNGLATPPVVLPEDKPMSISFVWGDEHPSDLKTDPAGLQVKHNAVPNNGIGELLFQVQAQGGEWTTLDYLSEDRDIDGYQSYWINEKYDLSAYVGQTVRFRWVHNSFSGRDEGQSIAHVVIDENLSSAASLNRSNWSAGKVNYGKAVCSGDVFTLFNQGTEPLVIKSAEFTTPNFSTSLTAGQTIESSGNNQFSVTFSALDANKAVNDELTVTFESGVTCTLPVSGEALAKDTYYYSFEPNDLDYVWDQDFTMIDADRASGYSFSAYHIYYSADGQRCAFSVENDSKEHGMYGMMNPVSGMHALVGSSGQSVNADNWIISKKLKAGAAAKFDFYGRNWESNQSVLPDPKHNVSVLVSTKGNTKTNDFETVMRVTEMPFCDNGEWNHYEVDLSAYAGQEIYVALRHTTTSPSNLAFFDDFTLSGFDTEAGAVNDIIADADDNAPVEYYNLQGMRLTERPATGLYIERRGNRAVKRLAR